MSRELVGVGLAPSVEPASEVFYVSLVSLRVQATEAETYILGPVVSSIPPWAKQVDVDAPTVVYTLGGFELELVAKTGIYFDRVEVNIANVCTGYRDYDSYEEGPWLHIRVPLSCRSLCKASVGGLLYNGLCSGYVDVNGCVYVEPVSGPPRVWLSYPDYGGSGPLTVSSSGLYACCSGCRLYVEEGSGCVNVYNVEFGSGCPARGDLYVLFKQGDRVVAYAKTGVTLYSGVVE